MAGAYLNQCMSLRSEDNAETERRNKRHKDQGSPEGFARHQMDHDAIQDMSHFGCSDDSHFYRSASDINMSEPSESQSSDGLGREKDSLVSAIRSLEKTINNHCILLSRRISPLTFNRRRGSMIPLVPSKASNDESRSQSPAVPIKIETTKELSGIQPPSKTDVLRTDKVIVYIRVVFLKIGEIDTMKENFAADAFVQAKWREPAFDGTTDINTDEIDWEKYWNPKLYVENNIGEPKETTWMAIRFNLKGEAIVYERRRIKGCFLENLELDEFPFDTQDLTLTITSEKSEADIDLEEDHSEISSINVQSFVDEQEWKLHSHVETWKRVTTRIYHNSKFKHPAISTSCRASRRPGFYIWNIFLVMLFICSLAFGTFTVKLTLPQNRLQLSFILLLTTITFKFVVSQTLPRISYLTYLDKYILTSMAILCAVCVWHSVVPLIHNPDKEWIAIQADRWALGLLGSTYILFHLIFFMYIYFVALKKRWKYNEKDHEHKERMKKLQRLQEQEWSDINSLRIDPL